MSVPPFAKAPGPGLPHPLKSTVYGEIHREASKGLGSLSRKSSHNSVHLSQISPSREQPAVCCPSSSAEGWLLLLPVACPAAPSMALHEEI